MGGKLLYKILRNRQNVKDKLKHLRNTIKSLFLKTCTSHAEKLD